MLDNKIEDKGVIFPFNPIIVDSVLEELKRINITFHETTELKARF